VISRISTLLNMGTSLAISTALASESVSMNDQPFSDGSASAGVGAAVGVAVVSALQA